MNKVDIQITQDGPRNAVVKLTGVLDSSDVSELPAISLLDFTSNEDTRFGALVGLRVDLIEYSIGQGIEIQLAWNGTIPQQIMPLAGRGKFATFNYGGFHPDMTRAGYDGSINLTSTGYTVGTTQNFTIILELVKLYK